MRFFLTFRRLIMRAGRAWLAEEGIGYLAVRGLNGIFRYDTTHPKINHYKMRFRFMSAKWNAATRYSAHPFTTGKTGARVHFFCLNYPRIRGWYQARVHPFSSGNGKGDICSLNRQTIGVLKLKRRTNWICLFWSGHVGATPGVPLQGAAARCCLKVLLLE